MFNVSSPSFIIMDEAMEELKMIYPDFLVTVAFERQRMLRNSEEEKRTEAEYIYKDYYDTYERYNGTYAQDVMGYSDDDIDTVFEGDPMAYWNID